MQEMEGKLLEMPEKDSPLAPIVSWYNIARQRANAPSHQLEAHYFGISIPKLRNIIDVNRFDDAHIELLDKHSIDLNVAARISQMSERWEEIMTDRYLADLLDSNRRLTDLWLTKKGDGVDTNDMMQIFIKEGYCAKVVQARVKKIGKSSKGFEKTLQSILTQIARGKNPSPKQINVVFQAINEERDSGVFNWSSASLKTHCQKSVELVENWDGN